MLGCQSVYAATVHKIQGLTLDKLYFKLGHWVPESGVYVALSRSRRLEDIGISRLISERDIRYSSEAMTFFSMFAEDVGLKMIRKTSILVGGSPLISPQSKPFHCFQCSSIADRDVIWIVVSIYFFDTAFTEAAELVPIYVYAVVNSLFVIFLIE